MTTVPAVGAIDCVLYPIGRYATNNSHTLQASARFLSDPSDIYLRVRYLDPGTVTTTCTIHTPHAIIWLYLTWAARQSATPTSAAYERASFS